VKIRTIFSNSENIFVPLLHRFDFTSFASTSILVTRGNAAVEKMTAPKLCKQEQAVEEGAVNGQGDPIFHTLINTCVENLILQKYFPSSSA
jgi:hypothetical protein